MRDCSYKEMGMSPEKLQACDTESKKVVMTEWLMSAILFYLPDVYVGLTMDQIAWYLRAPGSRWTVYRNEDGTIHPQAALEGLQQEFASEKEGKSIVDTFLKPRLPDSDKLLHLYTDVNNYYQPPEQTAIREFIYENRILAKQLEGPLTSMNTEYFEEIIGIWIFPKAAGCRQGRIVESYRARRELQKAFVEEARDEKIYDLGLVRCYEIYLGTPTEEDLASFTPQNDLEKLVDLLQIVMTDKIKAERKPALLHMRHNINITDKMKGDLKTVTYYEQLANDYNEKKSYYEKIANDYNEKKSYYEKIASDYNNKTASYDSLKVSYEDLKKENESLKNDNNSLLDANSSLLEENRRLKEMLK